MSNEVPLRKTNLVIISGMILVARRMITRNTSGRVGEGNWKGLGAFKIFLIINYNRQGWGAALASSQPCLNWRHGLRIHVLSQEAEGR